MQRRDRIKIAECGQSEQFQAWVGGGRLKSVQCHGRTTECTTGTGTGELLGALTTAAVTGATGVAECITTHIGQ
jgi:hypothetical protein